MPTQEERFKLSITTSYAFVLCEVSSAAIQLFMWIYILSHFLRASREVQKSRAPYLTVSAILTCFAVACAAMTSVSIFEVLYTVSGLPIADKGPARRRIYNELWIKGDLLREISIGIGDALLIYRYYIIYFDNIWMTICPLIIHLANIGVAIRSWYPLEGYRPAAFAAANGLLVVLLNIVVTTLISTRLLRGHKKLSENLPLSSHKLYIGAIAVLVEAAAPVAVAGLVWAIITVVPTTPELVIAQAAFQALFQVTAALAPQLIIFRVATGNSPAHRADSQGSISGEIRFGAGPTTSWDEESISEVRLRP
ncbi:hypothetical protein BKA70DRAFT_1279127, partial [Coprinopsis sp. MPI-PUGE-AT-0042]